MHRRVGGLGVAAISATLLLVAFLAYTDNAGSQAQSSGIIISEVAWAGTLHSPSDEWVELYNSGQNAVDIAGWTLADSSGDLFVELAGTLVPQSYFLLERTADDTVGDIPADQLYSGGLNNSGETLTLADENGAVVDTANLDGGEWPAGEGSPSYVSMERSSPLAPDSGGWASNDGVTLNGHDAGGNPIQGTPRAANSSWVSDPGELPDLVLSVSAPQESNAGESLRYELFFANEGLATAQAAILTDSLPAGVSYVSDDSGLTPDLTDVRQPVWTFGDIDAGSAFSFALTTTVAFTVNGTVVNELAAGSSTDEAQYANNYAEAETVIYAPDYEPILIGAVLYDGYEYEDADEAVQLRNVGTTTMTLAGWMLGDGSSEATIAGGAFVGPEQSIWLARDTEAFARQFGFAPDAVLAPWPGFANDGDEVILRRADGQTSDVLVYENGDTSTSGWAGPSVEPYHVSNLFAEEGQLLFRLIDEDTGLPVVDSNQALDWAQMMEDPVRGRKVRYPGWLLDRFFRPVVITTSAALTIAVAPDNAFQAVIRQIDSAQLSVQIETLTMENLAIGNALEAAAQRGVSVTVLLEGSPPGGIDDHERYICRRLEASGGACWFMIRDDDLRIHDRYRYLHAKFTLIDGERALISSENLSPFSLPDDDKSDGTWGRRGVVLVTDAVAVVERLSQLFADDFAPASHHDLLRWHADHSIYGDPPDNFVPITVTGGTTYTVRYPTPVSFAGEAVFNLLHAPENMLGSRDGLVALLQMAGAGDTVLVQQLAERSHWGASTATAESDPNPRLEAYIDAARRGATVRILLDSYFDNPEDPLSNTATCSYVKEIAALEHLPLWCTLDNPTGLGIHNKMVLLQIGGQGWIHVGSWNGTEQSTKGNREVAIQLQSNAAYEYLAALFESDWPHATWFPLVVSGFRGPANYPLISEILYDPNGPDDAEFIEIVNPTPDTLDLSNWMIADAVLPDDFEDARRFPAGTLLAPRDTLVIATSADSFESDFGFLPDFEIVDSLAHIPEMLDDPLWGDPAALLQMGNEGDEILLRSPGGLVIDVISYGAGFYPGVGACTLVEAPGYALERLPYWHDSDDCNDDFRSWPFPSPGQLP